METPGSLPAGTTITPIGPSGSATWRALCKRRSFPDGPVARSPAHRAPAPEAGDVVHADLPAPADGDPAADPVRRRPVDHGEPDHGGEHPAPRRHGGVDVAGRVARAARDGS